MRCRRRRRGRARGAAPGRGSASQTQLAWIIDAYSLVFASLLLPAGAIGDRFGRRRALIAGLSIFGAGSAVAMTAHSAAELIGLRAVLGLGAALVMPATLSTITGTFPGEQRTRAVSVWAAVAGGAAVLGLLSSGILLQVWTWPSVFGLNVVLACAAIAGTIRFVPESPDLAPALVARLGARKVCASGLALIAAAMAVLSQLTPVSGYWLLATGLVILGAGMGLAMTPATSGITSALPAAQQGVGSALNDLSRETGGAVGIAVLASILTATYQSHLSLDHVPAAQAGPARSSVAVATHLGGTVAAHAQLAFAAGQYPAAWASARPVRIFPIAPPDLHNGCTALSRVTARVDARWPTIWARPSRTRGINP